MTTKYADDAATEAARKAVEADKKASDKTRAEYEMRAKGKPTPTQEENDLVMHGAHILEHEHDGSEPDPTNVTRHVEAAPSRPAQAYQTRQQTAHKAE
jgi:hypothetical protein